MLEVEIVREDWGKGRSLSINFFRETDVEQ